MTKYIYPILLSLFITPVLYGQDCTFRLTGHVHSTVVHENLAHATVMLEGRNKILVTDANGDFRFENLCPGTYTVIITHANFDTTVKTIAVTKNAHLDIDLNPTQNVLQEVTITGLRIPVVTGIRKELSGRELEETRGQSLAEALSRITGISMLQTGTNIAKPIIHGLHSNRILTINNGVRQEGQQWGNEHAPEIDPFIANKITVVKGVDELRFG
ncbi:MAG TPA: carboxypeptidase-like regulatory domain-containing protein [Flavisolibacter sp.]|nr:carboxypeptidase-like regulatory domain-containing protein [Flavisolibacter sp.]